MAGLDLSGSTMCEIWAIIIKYFSNENVRKNHNSKKCMFQTFFLKTNSAILVSFGSVSWELSYYSKQSCYLDLRIGRYNNNVNRSPLKSEIDIFILPRHLIMTLGSH